jgi:hypothetical protein
MSGNEEKSKKDDKKKKIFQLDITHMGEMKELIFEYFFIVTELLKDQNFDLQALTLDVDSDKIIAEGWEQLEEDSEEDTDPDFTWV